MNKRHIVRTAVTAVLVLGLVTWLLERFWHYPTGKQTDEEPATAHG